MRSISITPATIATSRTGGILVTCGKVDADDADSQTPRRGRTIRPKFATARTFTRSQKLLYSTFGTLNGKETAAIPPEPIGRILRVFSDHGHAAYFGEEVSQTEHALQTAWAAEQAGAGAPLIAAALLHDVGHLLHHLGEECARHGIDDGHEDLGARFVERYFGPDVSEPIRLHVPAKRFLCAVETGYHARLSEASRHSLKLQGGPFTTAEVEQFRHHPHGDAALALRRWDEQAKIVGLETPTLDHFLPYLEAACVRQAD